MRSPAVNTSATNISPAPTDGHKQMNTARVAQRMLMQLSGLQRSIAVTITVVAVICLNPLLSVFGVFRLEYMCVCVRRCAVVRDERVSEDVSESESANTCSLTHMQQKGRISLRDELFVTHSRERERERLRAGLSEFAETNKKERKHVESGVSSVKL